MDGTTTYKKSAARTIGGAMIGSILSGGVGAVVGGLSGGSRKRKKIKKIDLKITVRDIENPCVVASFLNSEINLDASCLTVQNYMKSANEWEDRISTIIDTVNNEDYTVK